MGVGLGVGVGKGRVKFGVTGWVLVRVNYAWGRGLGHWLG